MAHFIRDLKDFTICLETFYVLNFRYISSAYFLLFYKNQETHTVCLKKGIFFGALCKLSYNKK